MNFKNYLELSSDNTLELAMAAQKAAHKLRVKTVLAPPPPSLSLVAQNVSIPVFCQHLDDMQAGQSTGFFIAELARSFGASGSILNHSEHRLDYQTIRSLVQRLRKLDMVSVVCARTANEAAELARLNPSFIAIEPPELIGSGKAVSKENPKAILDTVKLVSEYSDSTRVICGAGIVDKSDVRSALDLGVIGILVASGIVKANSWYDKILELASGFLE
ncbi:MAG TPA: triose-phosphate isomerase [Nitrososphaeraceae archaeon]|nr:triose-phosphate isomerase [Nitrososphaeraceae archaeon]